MPPIAANQRVFALLLMGYVQDMDTLSITETEKAVHWFGSGRRGHTCCNGLGAQ